MVLEMMNPSIKAPEGIESAVAGVLCNALFSLCDSNIKLGFFFNEGSPYNGIIDDPKME